MTDIVERLRRYRPTYGWPEERSVIVEPTLNHVAADEIERLQLREETLSGIIDGMTARFIEAQGAVEEIERLREALQKIAAVDDEKLPTPATQAEGVLWSTLNACVDLARKALGEKE